VHPKGSGEGDLGGEVMNARMRITIFMIFKRIGKSILRILMWIDIDQLFSTREKVNPVIALDQRVISNR
jgi:hypothetical protein